MVFASWCRLRPFLLPSLLFLACKSEPDRNNENPSALVGGAAGALSTTGSGGSSGATSSRPFAGGAGGGVRQTPGGSGGVGGLSPGKSDPFALTPCPPSSTAAKCRTTGTKNSVGKGITLPDSNPAAVTDGFVDAATHRLVVAIGNIQTNDVHYGAVFTIDLATGDRTHFSGTIVDPGTGAKAVGEGPNLLAQRSLYITPGPDGWYATAGGNAEPGILRVDPTNGNRTVAVSLTAAAFATGPCAHLTGTIALSPDGKIYMPYDYLLAQMIHRGIVEITPGPTPACRPIIDSKDEAIGSGWRPTDPRSVAFAQGSVWVFDELSRSLAMINPTTGASQRITTKDGDPGTGDRCFGDSGFALGEGRAWTFSAFSDTDCAGTPFLVSVETAPGPNLGRKRGNSTLADGPLDGPVQEVFPLPGQPEKVLYANYNLIYIYDRAKNLVNIFSDLKRFCSHRPLPLPIPLDACSSVNPSVLATRVVGGLLLGVGFVACFRSLDDLSSGRRDVSPAATSPTSPTSPSTATGGGASAENAPDPRSKSCEPALTCDGGVSCCASKVVSGGTFSMGPPVAVKDSASTDEIPSHAATVTDFALDVYEVTVGRFRRFVSEYNVLQPAEGAGAHPRIPGSGWQGAWQKEILPSPGDFRQKLFCDTRLATWTDTPILLENKPINCVTWYEAFLFCLWDGGRLPTEAEWEYAAAGGYDWIFPWGNDAIFAAGNTGQQNAVFHCTQFQAGPCSYANIGDVGSKGPGIGRWGQFDLGGNIGEFVLDSLQGDWYARGSCNDCANLSGDLKVVRGGDYTSPQLEALYRFKRAGSNPSSRKPTIGFRCAR